MLEKLPKLSKAGELLLTAAISDTKKEQKNYEHIRTRFYFPVHNNESFDCIQLRDFIDEVVKEFDMRFPFDDRDSDYSIFVNTKCFSILSMQLNRLHPDNYLVVTQKENGEVLFIIHDKETSPDKDYKITWDSGLNKSKYESIPLYPTRSDLD